jgi:hypothetical protein
MYQDKDVITVQEKLLEDVKKETPMEEEKVVYPEYWTIAQPPPVSQIPSGDNDCWQSVPEGKSRHYDSIPFAAFNEDLSKNEAIQEWTLNHLPLSQEQKKEVMDDLTSPGPYSNMSVISGSMIYQKPSLTKQTYDHLKEIKKAEKREKTRGLRTSVKDKDHTFTFSKTVITCPATVSSGDCSTTTEVHLVRPTRTPSKTL